MRGSIVQRNGHYSIILDEGKDPVTGKRRQRWISVKGNKREADRQLAELLNQVNNGTFVKPGKLTLGDYLESWLEDYCKPNLAPDTTYVYRIMCHTHIIPVLGQKPLTALKSQDIQKLERQKLLSGRCDGKGGLSNRSVRYIHITLNRSLKMAVKAGLLMRNPVDGVEPPVVKRHEFKTLNEDSINKLLKVLGPSEYYPLFFTDLFSGMRRSEILALQWSDIDFLGMTASVNRIIKVLKGGEIVFRPPKTAKSRRLIDLTPANVRILRELKAKQEHLRQSLGMLPLSDTDMVFCHYDGKPYLPDSISHVWMILVKRNGLAGVRLHDIRHSHASLLLKQGVHPKIVQERLGHASIAITLDLYSHVAPGLQAAAAKNFDNILQPKENKLD